MNPFTITPTIGRQDSVPLVLRIDTLIEGAYVSVGGILTYVRDQ